MSIVIKPPPPTVPLASVINGRIYVDPVWDLFFKALVERTGGTEAPTNSELSVALHDDAGIEETKADIYQIRNEAPPPVVQLPPQDTPDALVQALTEQVAEMRREIDALKAGTVL